MHRHWHLALISRCWEDVARHPFLASSTSIVSLLAQVLIAQCSAIPCSSRSNRCGPKMQSLHTTSRSLYLAPASCRHCGQIIWQVLLKSCFAKRTCFIGHLAQVASSTLYGQTAWSPHPLNHHLCLAAWVLSLLHVLQHFLQRSGAQFPLYEILFSVLNSKNCAPSRKS